MTQHSTPRTSPAQHCTPTLPGIWQQGVLNACLHQTSVHALPVGTQQFAAAFTSVFTSAGMHMKGACSYHMPRAMKMEPSLTMVGPATDGSSRSLNCASRFFLCSIKVLAEISLGNRYKVLLSVQTLVLTLHELGHSSIFHQHMTMYWQSQGPETAVSVHRCM